MSCHAPSPAALELLVVVIVVVVVVVRFHSIVIANVNKLFMRHINCPALWQRQQQRWLWPQCVCVCEGDSLIIYAKWQ